MKRFLFAVSALFTLAACETVEGFGRDVQSGGEALEDVSDDVQDDL